MAEKDSRLKYIEMTRIFHHRANSVDMHCKGSQRICAKLAGHLSRSKPKTPADFERTEYLKEFVLKTATVNEETIALLDYMKALLLEISEDSAALSDGAHTRDTIKFQSDTIRLLQEQRDSIIQDFVRK